MVRSEAPVGLAHAARPPSTFRPLNQPWMMGPWGPIVLALLEVVLQQLRQPCAAS